MCLKPLPFKPRARSLHNGCKDLANKWDKRTPNVNFIDSKSVSFDLCVKCFYKDVVPCITYKYVSSVQAIQIYLTMSYTPGVRFQNSFNSSVSSAAYMRQWIGSDNDIGAYSAPSHYLKQCWVTNQNARLSIQEYSYENIVRKMETILSKNWVNQSISRLGHQQDVCCPVVF